MILEKKLNGDERLTNRPLRVALVTEYYYPHFGGVTEHVQNLALHLRASGHDAIVITSHIPGATDDMPGVYRVGRSLVLLSNGSFARVTAGWDLKAKIRSILREERIDVVHLHGPLAPTLGLVAPDAAEELGIPVVGTFHSWFRRSLPYKIFRAPLQERLSRYAATIAVSVPAAEAHARYFEAPWEIIPNGVDVDQFHPNGRRPPDAVKAAPRLLFLGRLDPRNGLDQVLAAMPRILDVFPRAELIVAGDGPLRPVYERQAQKLGQNVRFLGRVYEDRPALYGSSDLYLCPTNKASFGITLLEAMACGTPIIGSNICGFRELVAGGKTLLIPPDDSSAWADAVVHLIGDPSLRAEMSAWGLKKAARYSWTDVSARVLQVYRRVARA
jgi:phosphatidyl-myo-inositol alpha-mannosyltransferase